MTSLLMGQGNKPASEILLGLLSFGGCPECWVATPPLARVDNLVACPAYSEPIADIEPAFYIVIPCYYMVSD